ncbi:methanethiol S-methyltransferase [Rhodococcus sp. NM-2]|jgi:protein-S-isoprenylcysteine O-methyltransferase Ste14|uniref:methanethiol S-methyltransferase n=1 Tax=Rhodococcus TaxID=1827 RepID=UPI00294A197F|nr:methanethiol S-methyltransferase [Rhodococcus opacus]MDV6244510.1 isoprenylcysteine carboxylmethyltransferase family protein [Rhodococcus opacus]
MAEMVESPQAHRTGGVARTLITVYGMVVYATFLIVFLYAIGWVEGLVVPHTINDGPDAPVAVAVVIDVALLTVFAMQHSVMARPWFKKRWTRIVPQPMERSTYVLFATAALALLMWQWRPLPDQIWDVETDWVRVVIYVVSLGGWALVLAATFAIDHFDLFGLRQVLRNQSGKSALPSHFRTPVMYRVIRHPLYAGFIIAFWVAPTMTWGRLLFAVGTTGFILVAVRFEEHDLVDTFGDDYRTYRSRVPMLVPRVGSRGR